MPNCTKLKKPSPVRRLRNRSVDPPPLPEPNPTLFKSPNDANPFSALNVPDTSDDEHSVPPSVNLPCKPSPTGLPITGPPFYPP